MLYCLTYMSHLQYIARGFFFFFHFLGLFASESFVFIVQSGSAVLHCTLKVLLDKWLSKTHQAVLVQDHRGGSWHRQADLTGSKLASLSHCPDSHSSWHGEKSEWYRELEDNGNVMMLSILIKDFGRIQSYICVEYWNMRIIFERERCFSESSAKSVVVKNVK